MNGPARTAPGRRRQRGIALVVVLWLIVLLSVIAASHARVIRTETRLASNQVEASKARSMAEAGAQHAILELLVRDDTLRWPVDGSPRRIGFAAGTVDISIRDARGLLDINHVQAALLDVLLEGAGVDDQSRPELVDATLDWRDRDNLKHLHGAEDNDYRRAGLQWEARDGPFSCVEEFRYVLGMTGPIFQRLAPYLTVHSGQATVALDLAPPWLAGLLADRPGTTTAGSAGRQRGGSTFHVTVRATSTGGATASLEMVVRITPAGKEPYTILAWRTPAPGAAVPAGDTEENAAAG